MKRLLVLVLTMAMAFSAVATAEARESGRTERTVQGSYGAYPTPVTGCNSALGPWACLIVRTRAKEAFFTATVADTHGQPVGVDVFSGGRLLASFCGKTTRPIAITPGSTLEFDTVWVEARSHLARRIASRRPGRSRSRCPTRDDRGDYSTSWRCACSSRPRTRLARSFSSPSRRAHC